MYIFTSERGSSKLAFSGLGKPLYYMFSHYRFTKSGDRNFIGMVVLRGNSVVMLEAKDRL